MDSPDDPTHPADTIAEVLAAPVPPTRSRPAAGTIGAMLLGLLAVPIAIVAVADDAPTGRRIMEAVDARDDGDLGVSDMEMILVDQHDNERVRTIRSYSRDVEEGTETIMFFLSPADVKGTGFLTYDYAAPARDDDQWLYLPALKKTKRIAGGNKRGSFMGSDFTYADMTDRPLDRYEYTLMQETEVEGVPVWQIEAVPNEKEIEETGYTRSILFVRRDVPLVIRSVSWLESGGRLKYFEASDLRLVDGVWVPHVLTMKTTRGRSALHRTIIQVSNVKFGEDLGDETFTVRRLERGR